MSLSEKLSRENGWLNSERTLSNKLIERHNCVYFCLIRIADVQTNLSVDV